MPAPRIGITLDLGAPDENRATLELPRDYPAAILRAGGLPLLLPMTSDPERRHEMMDLIDGLLVPGGRDLDPQLYGQARHEKTQTLDPQRQSFDLALLSIAEQRRMPTLGVCLGCQMMNVHRGGTLHQHLPDVERPASLLHSRAGDRSNAHEIAVRGGTGLASIVQADQISANSRHHQAVDQLGHGLQTAAAAPDGTIEAIEDPSLPFWMAVQWHPENLAGSPHERLFEALVRAAETYRRKKE